MSTSQSSSISESNLDSFIDVNSDNPFLAIIAPYGKAYWKIILQD
jgi:hypothetical protein